MNCGCHLGSSSFSVLLSKLAVTCWFCARATPSQYTRVTQLDDEDVIMVHIGWRTAGCYSTILQLRRTLRYRLLSTHLNTDPTPSIHPSTVALQPLESLGRLTNILPLVPVLCFLLPSLNIQSLTPLDYPYYWPHQTLSLPPHRCYYHTHSGRRCYHNFSAAAISGTVNYEATISGTTWQSTLFICLIS